MINENDFGRIGDIEKSRAVSDAELLKGGAKYDIDPQTREKRLTLTESQLEKINEAIEALLAGGLATAESLSSGDLDISFDGGKDTIEYEFELEEEQRINVRPENFEIKSWPNHVVDVYDQSGRCRIRTKNGKARLSLKVPLMSKDTRKSKCCIRLEFKPISPAQESDLAKIQALILEEPGTQVHEKWGAPLDLSNGEKVWVNKDESGNHWIETDGSEKIEDFLPEGMRFLGHSKSKIKVAGAGQPEAGK